MKTMKIKICISVVLCLFVIDAFSEGVKDIDISKSKGTLLLKPYEKDGKFYSSHFQTGSNFLDFPRDQLMTTKEKKAQKRISIKANIIISHGGIIRGDTTKKEIAMVFSGNKFGEGGNYIAKVLQEQNIHASFFLTGNFYRNPKFKTLIEKLKRNGDYLGSHSDKHLLYASWTDRDSTLVTKEKFTEDLQNSYKELKKFGISKSDAHYFLPPYEWYNDSIAAWTQQMGLQLVDLSEGTRSASDWTYPGVSGYCPSNTIMKSILQYEQKSTNGLNGFILLLHIGAGPKRTDKFYKLLPALIQDLKNRGYQFVKINELLNPYCSYKSAIP